ncbi:hypothetical protein ACP70R_001127 [Stipagrostis hirtigluma subsp. patula]
MMYIYEGNNHEKLTTVLPVKKHCDVCDDDTKMTAITSVADSTPLIVKTVDPRVIEWTARYTGQMNLTPPACSRTDWITGTLDLQSEDFLLAPNLDMVPVQKARLLALVRHGSVPPPIYVVKVSELHNQDYVLIPRRYTMDYLPRTRRDIILEDGFSCRVFRVTYKVRRDKRGVLTDG